MARKKRALKVEALEDTTAVKLASFRPSMPWNIESIPVQRLMDKIGHSHAWQVMRCTPDFENRQIVYQLMVNSNTSEFRTISFPEAAEHFGWKDLKFSDDLQIAFPVM